MDSGTEIRLFDPQRTPRNWTDLLSPTQCAVFLKNTTGSVSLDPNGKAYARTTDATCIVFDRLDQAQQYCEAKVQALPHVRCQVYDAKGLAKPPLLVILHPDVQRKDDNGPLWSRRRKVIAVCLLLIAVPLFWTGTKPTASSDLAIFFGFNCFLTALRLFYWNVGLKYRERERETRVQEHRKTESGDA